MGIEQLVLDATSGLSPFDPAVLAIYEAMPEPVWLSHPDGRIAFASQKALELLGLRPEDVYENGWRHLLHPDEEAFVVESVVHTLQTGEPYDIECRLQTPDGSYRWIRSRANAYRDAGGTIVGFIGHLVDIDRYKSAELQARSSELRLRRLLDSQLIGFVRVTMDGVIVECNESYARSLGYARDELRGKTIVEITPQEWYDDDARAFELLREQGFCGPFRKEYFRRDGSRLPILAVGAREPDSDNLVAAYVIDLSTQRDLETAFIEARRLNDTLLQAMPLIFWLSDPSGEVEYFSPWFYEYTGLAIPEEGVGDFWSVIHGDDLDGAAARWEEIRSHGRPADRFVRYRRADGTYRWHHVHSTPVTGPNGEITGWLGFSMDVHDQRRAAERQHFLLRATERLSPLLEPSQLFRVLVGECIPEMGDTAQLFLYEDGVLRLAEVAADTPEREARLREVNATTAHAPMYAALRSREPVLYRNLQTREDERMDARDREIIAEFKTRSLVLTPLANEIGAWGVLVTAFSSTDREFEQEDVQTLQLLGQRVSVIIESAQRFAREHRVAEALQRASLPQTLSVPQGVRLHPFYSAAASEAQIGGDWYDALELADGRLMLSIGDVAGHGLEAAVTMGNIRQIIRGIAHVHPDPALMLEAADRALRTEHPNAYVTSFACVFDPIESSLTFASAGHPPALLRRVNGEVVVLEAPGLPLGLRGSLDSKSSVVPVHPGDVLVLYTDGLTEARRQPLQGERELIEALADGAALNAPDPAAALYAALTSGDVLDDTAILVARFDAFAGENGRVSRFIGNVHDGAAMSRLRAEIVRRAMTILGEADAFGVELVFSELVGNVVRHASEEAEFILEARPASVVLHVLDRGEGFEFAPKLPIDHFSERGRGLFLAASFADEFSVSRRSGGGSHARAVFIRKR